MTTKKEHWYNNPWVVGIGILFLTPLVSVIIDFFKGVNIFDTLGSWIILFFKILNTPINLTVFQALCLVIPMIFFAYSFFNLMFSKYKKPLVVDAKPFLNYKTDVLKQWTWEWEYSVYDGGFEIINLIPLCPICNTIMKLSYGNYECVRCNNVYGSTYMSYGGYRNIQYSENANDIKTLIEDNIRKNNYPSAPST